MTAAFGSARAHWALQALTTGDPLMDAVVDELVEGVPGVRPALQQGFREGLASLVEPPPAVRALLDQVETKPDDLFDLRLDEGAGPFFTVPPPVHIISLSAGALIRVYSSPSIAAVLGGTGRLVDGAERRIAETGRWLVTAMLPGGLERGAPGYVATLQVRLLHAQMRRVARDRGYDEVVHGVPINQVDLMRTWIDFTHTSMTAEAAMGFDLSDREVEGMYRYWQYVGHLLGIEPEATSRITNHEQAAQTDALLQMITGAMEPAAAGLAKATLDSIAAVLHNTLKLPRPIGLKLLRTLTRRFHGHHMADELALRPEPVTSAVVRLASAVVRRRRLALRNDGVKWRQAKANHVAQAREVVDRQQDALFETSS